jgi:N-acetylmuramic acid 6-phosphate etherase
MVVRNELKGLRLDSRLPLDAATVPETFERALAGMFATLKSKPVLSQLATLTTLEETLYRAGHKTSYFADHFGIDILTDTTERSPTYCTPPFRKFDDPAATESWAFLFVPYAGTPEAWRHILKRPPNCIEWTQEEVQALVGPERAARTYETVRKISHAELTRFRIGLDGLRFRLTGKGDAAVGILSDAEKASLLSHGGFHRTQLEAAHAAGARVGLVCLGQEESLGAVEQFVHTWNPECVSVLVPVPTTDFLLDGITRVGLKALLNAHSTCTMVRLGRVMGNYMIWVVPSNLKLIDRATRYIERLTKLNYAEANHLLFEVIEYVEPRMKADQAYPPVVGVAVTRMRHGVGNHEAERILLSNP